MNSTNNPKHVISRGGRGVKSSWQSGAYRLRTLYYLSSLKLRRMTHLTMWSQESSVTRSTPQKRNQMPRGRQNIARRPLPRADANYPNSGQRTSRKRLYIGLGASLAQLNGQHIENSPES